ncbi:MAG TPA: class I SAM-dependent methyltransferase [Vicinamibacterales bacterium]|jgi:ubiquinone/menaquinone biosynthesis C-methylase UbiE|nr:class I SAM-dependent methyltransferase [Vicinamibacterales bacterium]
MEALPRPREVNPPRFSIADLRRYYDRNTARFVSLGQGGGVGAIHRAVWGPGVRTRDEAFHYVEDRIGDHVRRLPLEVEKPHVVDLGCGVGASLCYLAAMLPTITATGVTVSLVQARLAQERIERARLTARVSCVEGDFVDLPPGIRPAHLAYAIEAFVHAPSPEGFFSECRKLIVPGGLLILCDDFKRPTSSAVAEANIARFARGWHINTLLSSAELQELAEEAGFEHRSTTDLTHYLELNRPRDRVVRAALPLVAWLPLHATRFGHLVGGTALQRCLDERWVGYDFVVFHRR